jgi:predicted amidohydrolase
MHSAADSVAKFIEVAKLNVKRSDLLVLPEAISISGNGLSYVDAAEPIPGPSTEALGQLARDLNSYVVAGLMEREGASAYNTAVLIDRQWRAGWQVPQGVSPPRRGGRRADAGPELSRVRHRFRPHRT